MATMQPALLLQALEKGKGPNLHTKKGEESKGDTLFDELLTLLKEDMPASDAWRHLLLKLGENESEKSTPKIELSSDILKTLKDSKPSVLPKLDVEEKKSDKEKEGKLLATLLRRDLSAQTVRSTRQKSDDEIVTLKTLLRKDHDKTDPKPLQPADKEIKEKDLLARTLLALRATRKELDALRSIQRLKSGKSVADLREWAKRAGLEPKMIRYTESDNVKPDKPLPKTPTLSLPTSELLLHKKPLKVKEIAAKTAKVETPIKRLADLLETESTPKDASNKSNIRSTEPPKPSSTLLADLLFANNKEVKNRGTKAETLHDLLSKKSDKKERTTLSNAMTKIGIKSHHHSRHQTEEIEITAVSAQKENSEHVTENFKESKTEPTLHSSHHDTAMLKKEILDAKATVRHFARTLQEQVENYKPPFSRMQMSLDPKELGSVEVTLVSRGNQLHVQVHSNPTAIGVMATQGQELKQQLVNMGFTDVQMQFNMNQQQKQQQQKHSKTVPDGYLEVEEIPDFYESLDLIIPHYV